GRRRIRVRGHQRLTSHIRRVQTAQIVMTEVEAIDGQLVGNGDLKPLHGVSWLSAPQRGQRVKNRRVGKFHERIFREAFLQVAGERLRSGKVFRESQSKTGGVLDVTSVRKRERR